MDGDKTLFYVFVLGCYHHGRQERTGEAFAHQVGDNWGVGDAGCDNGHWAIEGAHLNPF